MSALNTLRLLRVLGLVSAVSAAVACGDDEKKDGPTGALPEGDASVSTPTPTDSGRPNVSMDAGPRNTMDATTVVPTNDGAVAVDAAVASDAGTTPGLVDDAGKPIVPLVALPSDGTRLSACYDADDCKGDDLTCVASLGARGAGFCSDDCREDKDCTAVSGVPATCSSAGQCVFDCAGADGKGGGACPANMVCRDVTDGNLLVDASYRCTYPVGAGSKSVAAGGKCERAHGNGDCASTLVCHLPSGGLVSSPEDGTGVCTPACKLASDCQVPSGTTAAAVCDEGACEYDCSATNATCPTGSTCRDVDDVPVLSELRCRP